MYIRELSQEILKRAKKYPIITIVGPRQSGKTTLSRSLFKEYTYVSLEDSDQRMFATEDPRGFFSKYKGSIILDEIQKAPELTSYIQTMVDAPDNKRKFVITGSHGNLLMSAVSQSLAGRTSVFELLPFSIKEIFQKQKLCINEILFKGGYPRIYNDDLNPSIWYKEYFKLYIERDIRLITRIQELDVFEKFVYLIAGRAGQLLNYNSLANEVGKEQPTIKSWVNSLKTTFICFSLQPHFKNFNKRIIKTPKLYFYDTGLLCYLLKIHSPEILDTHPLRGAIFENFVISEFYKKWLNKGLEPPFYFWRDQKGHEIDLIIDEGTHLYPIEIKFSETFTNGFIKNLEYINKLQNFRNGDFGKVIYKGNDAFNFKQYSILPWTNI